MLLKPKHDWEIYRACPEIRSYIRRIYGWALLRAICILPVIVVSGILVMPGFVVRALDVALEYTLNALAYWNTERILDGTEFMADHMDQILAESRLVLSVDQIQDRVPSPPHPDDVMDEE